MYGLLPWEKNSLEQGQYQKRVRAFNERRSIAVSRGEQLVAGLKVNTAPPAFCTWHKYLGVIFLLWGIIYCKRSEQIL